MKNFKSVLELITYFKDDSICRSYLEEMIWDNKPICPHCGSERFYRFKGGKQFKCASNTCYKKFTVTTGTMFDSSKISLVKWFIAIYLHTSHKKGISSYQLAKDIDVSQKSAWFMVSRLREMDMSKERQVFDGVIEADETFIGGSDANRHEYKKKGKDSQIPVLGIVERGGRLLVVPIAARQTKYILQPIISTVKPESVINTDDFKAYRQLKNNYTHFKVNHTDKEFVNGLAHTNTIEGAFSQLKRSIYGCYHSVSPKHLHRYCNETAFRYSTRFMKEDERFALAIKQATTVLRYKELIAKPK